MGFIKLIVCPHCGGKNAKVFSYEKFPYQAEPYKSTYIECECGFIKDEEDI